MIATTDTALSIIQNATQLFLTRGFKSVTMDDLAAEMGISKKTIYVNFRNKSDLVKAVAEHLFEVISSGIDEIRTQNLNPIEELFVINDFVLVNLKNEGSSPQYQLQKYYPKIHENFSERQFTVAHECILENLKTGVKLGLFKKNINIEIISRIYFLIITGTKNQELFPNKEFPVHELIPTYLEYHIRGIATKKGRQILEEVQKKRIKY